MSDSTVSRRRMTIVTAVLAVVCFAVYANGLWGAFLYDDNRFILQNPVIHRLFPLDRFLRTGRPLLDVTLALNYAVGGTNPLGYHLVNVLIHLMASLTLFALLRRIFESSRLRDRFGAEATRLALVCSLLWMAHPLQTESVTYIIQRAESLMGLCYLLTLYFGARGLEAQRRWPWFVASAAAFLAGMGAKQTIITAPVALFLYDRTFVSGSFKQTVKRGWPYYGAFCLMMALLMAAALRQTAGSGSAGFGLRITPCQYALTQSGVILEYLGKCFWPARLCFENRWPIALRLKNVAGPMMGLGIIGAAVIWALVKKPAAGFAGVWFFLILAPTSSILPIADVYAEHRLYLALAGPVVLTAAFVYYCWSRISLLESHKRAIAVIAAAVWIGTLSFLTIRRNEDYRTPLAMWGDVVQKCPASRRAHNEYGKALLEAGRAEEAEEQFRATIELDKKMLVVNNKYRLDEYAHTGLALALMAQGRAQEALEALTKAVERQTNPELERTLGAMLLDRGQAEAAAEHFRKALALMPESAAAHAGLGDALAMQKDYSGAADAYATAVRQRPGDANLLNNYGNALRLTGRTAEAIAQYQAALQASPERVDILHNLAWAVLAAQPPRTAEARRALDQILKLEGKTQGSDALESALKAAGAR